MTAERRATRRTTWPTQSARKAAYALMEQAHFRSQGHEFEETPLKPITDFEEALRTQTRREQRYANYISSNMDKLNAMCAIVALVEGKTLEQIRHKVTGY